VPTLTGFYAMVKQAAQSFDGRDPIRPIKFD
jgi:hypothetical protein